MPTKAIRGQKLFDEIISMSDKFEGKYKKSFLRSMLSINDDKELKALVKDIADGKLGVGENIGSRLDKVRIDIAELNEISRQTMVQAANVTKKVMNISGSFDVVNDAVIEAARQMSIQLSTNLRATTRENLRQIIEDFASGDISRQEAIKQIQLNVGLLPQHSQAVKTYRKTLIASGTPRQKANDLAEQYAKRLLKYRAETIARTEVGRAVGIGKTNFWRQMQQQDMLPPDAQRVWITEPVGACPFCISMNGEVADIDGGWNTAKGYLEYPKASHPNCRCDDGIVMSPQKKGRVSKIEEIAWGIWVSKGESAGHPFRGNQWVSVIGASVFTKKEYKAFSEDVWYGNDLAPAIRHYMGVGYKKINENLRATQGLAEDYESRQVLYEWARRATGMPRDATVYRGTTTDSPPAYKEGDVIQNNGFTSTTVSRAVAQEFSTMGDSSRSHVLYKIAVPKGTRVIPLGSTESELLFAPTLKMRIHSVKQSKDGTYVVNAEVVKYQREARLA